jgi:hypothetical protein
MSKPEKTVKTIITQHGGKVGGLLAAFMLFTALLMRDTPAASFHSGSQLFQQADMISATNTAMKLFSPEESSIRIAGNDDVPTELYGRNNSLFKSKRGLSFSASGMQMLPAPRNLPSSVDSQNILGGDISADDTLSALSGLSDLQDRNSSWGWLANDVRHTEQNRNRSRSAFGEANNGAKLAAD